MPLTLRNLASSVELDLTLLAEGPGVDLPVTWVHVSELRDPTPFLSGGELLLTTGIAFNRDSNAEAFDVAHYVRQLSEASVVGLGFGTGLSHAQVPDELVVAARKIGLPIVEVPRQTPFIAISRAVSKAVAADEYAAVTRTFTAQQELTKAALSPAGPQRLVRLLARQLDAWVVLLDPTGVPVAGSPGGPMAGSLDAAGGSRGGLVGGVLDAAGGSQGGLVAGSQNAAGSSHDAAIADSSGALEREVTSIASHRGTVSSAFTLGSDTVSLQSVGTGPRGRAFLAVGRPESLSAADRHLVNAAVMLLTIRLEQSSTADSGMGRLRSALLQMVLAGQIELARPIAEGSSIKLPTEPLSVVFATGDVAGLLLAADETGGPASGDVLVAELDDALVAIVGGSPAAAQEWAARISRTDSAGRPARDTRSEPAITMTEDGSYSAQRSRSEIENAIGVSARTGYAEIAGAYRQAKQAVAFGRRNHRSVTSFGEIAMAGISGIIAPDDARAFAEALLRPLMEHDLAGRGDLMNSLRAWLAHHGQWEPSAAALGVHRHTLRHRMRTVEELLGRSLDAPGARSELWLALEMIGED